MDPRQNLPTSRQTGPYPSSNTYSHQYPLHQQQQPYNSQVQPMQHYTGGPQAHTAYGAPLQPLNTTQGMYSQSDVMRSSSGSSTYQHRSASGPISSPNSLPNYSPISKPQGSQEQSGGPPPSPSLSDTQEGEEAFRRTSVGPPPEMHLYQGFKYGLVVAQDPIRARMCGFGDKDRRPITTPPICQAVIFRADTDQELDYTKCDFELSHFVVQVHIYDSNGLVEKSIVKTAPGQQIISATLASGYPSTPMPASPGRMPIRLPLEDPTYARAQARFPAAGQSVQTYTASPFSNGTNTANGAMFPTAAPPPMHSQVGGSIYGPYGGFHRSSMSMPNPSAGLPIGPSQPPTPPLSRAEEAGPGYSRNLIGANTVSGQLLEDHKNRWGIFFCFTDLSVRSEDWFRLKFSLFNVGESLVGLSNEQIFKMAEENNSAPTTVTGFEAGKSSHKRLEGLKAGLIAKTAPCLATVWSQPFKVYSAKKFPGVAESTELSRKFAKQGVKISVRKESKAGDKRKRNEDGDEYDDDEDYD